MASDVEIVNVALTLLGESRVISLDDDVKQAREAKAMYTIVRDALLASYDWSFAKARTQLPALAGAPLFEFPYKYQLPVDCLRVTMIGDVYVGVNLSDYNNAPSDDYTIEGREILTHFGAPLNIKFVKQITDPGKFAAAFTRALGCRLAVDLCEALTQSNSKKDKMGEHFTEAIRLAIRANAIEVPPKKIADDEWLLSRL